MLQCFIECKAGQNSDAVTDDDPSGVTEDSNDSNEDNGGEKPAKPTTEPGKSYVKSGVV